MTTFWFAIVVGYVIGAVVGWLVRGKHEEGNARRAADAEVDLKGLRRRVQLQADELARYREWERSVPYGPQLKAERNAAVAARDQALRERDAALDRREDERHARAVLREVRRVALPNDSPTALANPAMIVAIDRALGDIRTPLPPVTYREMGPRDVRNELIDEPLATMKKDDLLN